MVDDTFNVASKDNPLQIRAREESDRQRKIDDLKDKKDQRTLQTMLNDRDHKVAERKEINDRKENNLVAEQAEKIKFELKKEYRHPTAPAESVIERTNRMRKQVREGYGRELDKELQRYEDKFNKNIDRSISKAMKKEQQSLDKKATLTLDADSGSIATPTKDFRKGRGRPHKVGHTASSQANKPMPKDPSYKENYNDLSKKLKEERQLNADYKNEAERLKQEKNPAIREQENKDMDVYEKAEALRQSISDRLEKRQNRSENHSKSQKL